MATEWLVCLVPWQLQLTVWYINLSHSRVQFVLMSMMICEFCKLRSWLFCCSCWGRSSHWQCWRWAGGRGKAFAHSSPACWKGCSSFKLHQDFARLYFFESKQTGNKRELCECMLPTVLARMVVQKHRVKDSHQSGDVEEKTVTCSFV